MSSEINFQRSEHDRSSPSNTAALFVSLYVVVLAFFIVLAANSQFDVEKTKTASQSVRKAFSTELETDVSVPLPSIGNELSVTQFFKEMQESIQSVVPVTEMEVITDGQMMVMKIPVTSLFNRNDPHLRHDRRDFYNRLAAPMRKWRNGVELHLSFLHGTEKPARHGATAFSSLEISRTGNFVRFMENKGANPHSLSIALEQGNAGQLTFIFDVRAFDAGKLDFGKAKTKPTSASTKILLQGESEKGRP